MIILLDIIFFIQKNVKLEKDDCMCCLSLTSACQDSGGLVRPQACSQQSQTGEGDDTVWCN